MPKAICITTNPPATEGGKGSSNTARLKLAFPQNPVGVEDELNSEGGRDSKLHKLYQELALNGVVEGGFMIGEAFDRDYSNNDAPDINAVEVGAGGFPGTPYSPNTASSPSLLAADLPEPPPVAPAGERPTQYGSGDNATLRSVNESSTNMAGLTLGKYGLGTSAQQP